MNKNLRKMLIPKSILTEDYDLGEIVADLRNGKDSGVSENTYWELNGEKSPKEVAEFVAEGELEGDDWELILDEEGVVGTLEGRDDEPSKIALALFLADKDEFEAVAILDELEESRYEGSYSGDVYEYAKSEYVVYDDYFTAEEDAKDFVKDDISQGMFNAEYLKDFVEENYFENYVREDLEYLANDMSDDEAIEWLSVEDYDLADYCEFKVTEEEFEENREDYEDYEDYEEFVADNEDDLDNWELSDRDGFEEEYVDYRMRNEFYDNGSQIERMIDFYGDMEELLKRFPDCIDENEVADYTVDSDGVAYYLAPYDGDENEIYYDDTKYYIYRID